MKLSLGLGFVAAVLFMTAATNADAFMVQSSRGLADANGARVADPDDIQQNMSDRWSNHWSDGDSTQGTARIGGTTLHFGMSQSPGGLFGGNNWFLDSPAARTVPSQR